MSIKSFLQYFILILIILFIGYVYINYLSKDQTVVEQIDSVEQVESIQENKDTSNLQAKKEILNVEKNMTTENNDKIEKEETININEKEDGLNKTKVTKNEILIEEKIEKKEIETAKEEKVDIQKDDISLVSEVEYITTDKRGNIFKLIADSAKTNSKNNNILDLINVKGTITSPIRSTIYIVSDYAMYDSSNLNSYFYDNVVINYEDKEIDCDNFDINMDSNLAIAYNNVTVTDPKSVMNAGKIIFDTVTKDVNILPASEIEKINVITN